MICDFLIEDKTIPFINSKKGKVIRERINDYYDYLDRENFQKIDIWPEKDKYFEKIFGMPRILHKAGVDKDFYKMRKNTFFESEICNSSN